MTVLSLEVTERALEIDISKRTIRRNLWFGARVLYEGKYRDGWSTIHAGPDGRTEPVYRAFVIVACREPGKEPEHYLRYDAAAGEGKDQVPHNIQLNVDVPPDLYEELSSIRVADYRIVVVATFHFAAHPAMLTGMAFTEWRTDISGRERPEEVTIHIMERTPPSD